MSTKTRAAQRTAPSTAPSTAHTAPSTAPSIAPSTAPRIAPRTTPGNTMHSHALRAAFCAVLFALSGESARGVGHCADGIKVPAGNPSPLLALVESAPPGTRFCLNPGVHKVSSEIVPKEGMTFKGAGASSTVLRSAGAARAFAGYGGSPRGVLISGITFEGFDTAVKTTDGWIVLNSVFHSNRVGMTLNGTRVRVEGNVMRDNTQYGMTASGADDSLIENNEIAHNNTREGATAWDGDAGGTKFIRSDGLVLRGNWVHHNMGNGLWADGNMIRTLYESNWVHHNTGVGIFHELGHDAVIRGNVLRRNAVDAGAHAARSIWWGSNIHLVNSQNVQVYHNAIESGPKGNGIGIVHYENRGSGWYGKWESRRISVYRNSISVAHSAVHSASAAGFVWNGITAADAFSRQIHFAQNHYHNAAPYAWVWGPSSLTWAQWQEGAAQGSASARAAQDTQGTTGP